MTDIVNKPTRICTVIPTHNRREALDTILQQLHEQLISNIELFTVVVVDGSSDGTLEMLSAHYPEVLVVIGDGTWWYTKSLNEGIKRGITLSPDYVLTLNDDCIIERDYVQSIYDAIRSCNTTCLVGSLCLSTSQPRIIFFAGVREIYWPLYRWRYYFPMGTKADAVTEVRMLPSVVLPGRGMLIPTSVINSVGYFDESFPQYGSDEDFSLRAMGAGVKSFVSFKAIVYSDIRSTDKSSVFLSHGYFVNYLKSFFNVYSSNYLGKEIRFLARHGCWMYLPITIPKIIAGRILRFYFGKKI